MEKFKRVERPREESADDEVRVTNQGRVATYVAYAARLFRDENRDTITVRASGLAIPIAISTVEILKRRVKGLHQLTKIGITQLVEEYEPLEQGLERQTRTRTVPFVLVTLSKLQGAVNVEAPGYQAPLDESLVRELKEYSGGEEGTSRPGGPRRGGRGGGGRRGAGLGTRGRSGRPRGIRGGRGRGG